MTNERLFVVIRRQTRFPYADPRYRRPTGADIVALLQHVRWSDEETAQRLGVSTRRLREWVVGEIVIPYAAWRLLLVESGLALAGLPVRTNQ